MNILQLISSGLGYYGAERVVVTLSSALEEMGIKSVVSAFLNTSKQKHVEVLDRADALGLQTEQIVCKGRLDWNAVRAIREIVERHSIDVIHCHGIKPDLYSVLAACQGVALVSTCHLWVFDSPKDWAISAVERSLLHGVDRVAAVSDRIIPQLRRFGLKGDVIYNGIDLEPFRDSNTQLRKSMNWHERPVIGAIGRLARQKGLQYLLRAAAETIHDYPNAIVVIAGDGPERESLEAEARNLGIHDAVHFLGVWHDIPGLLSSIDVLAMPSLSEGMPMALLEAMASAKAVVASSVGAIPRLIQDRVSGILVSPGDSIGLARGLRDLLQSSDLRCSLGRNGRLMVESRFSAASMARQYSDLYREAACNRGRMVGTARVQS